MARAKQNNAKKDKNYIRKKEENIKKLKVIDNKPIEDAVTKNSHLNKCSNSDVKITSLNIKVMKWKKLKV